MRFLTASTRASPGFERFLASCRRFGISPQVLGMGTNYPGHGLRLGWVHTALLQLPDDEICVFTDAWDVVFLRDPGPLAEVFARFGKPLVFSTEPYFSFSGPDFVRVLRHYPPGRPPCPEHRFLSGGCWVGRAGFVRQAIAGMRFEEHPDNDQAIWNRWFVEHPGAAGLDYGQQIFATSAWRVGLERVDFAERDGRLFQRRAGTFPFAVHFPGENTVTSNMILDMVAFDLPRVPVTRRDRVMYWLRAPQCWLLHLLHLPPNPYARVLEYASCGALAALLVVAAIAVVGVAR